MKKLLLFLCVCLLVMPSGFAKKPDTPKYIIMIIGDGMSINGICAAENYLAYKEGKKFLGPRLAMRTLPYFGMCDTYCCNNVVTCSAAAGTAIACGVKTNTSYIGMDEAGKPVKSIASILHERGYNVGIITNEPINHATPACFYAHHTSRSHYSLFAQQMPQTGFEVFGGDGFIADKKRKEYKNFDGVSYMKENGYAVCYGPQELKACPKDQKVCLFQPSSRISESKITAEADENKTYDIEEAVKGDMTVQEMLEATIERLGDKKPFFIMCEGGDIDHAAHSGFAMSMINEIIELDKAVQSALEFYEKHPKETLVIVTSDHETGGVCITKDDESIKFVDWKTLEEDWEANKSRGFNQADLCRQMSKDAKILYATPHHSAGNVPVFAIGKHAERFSNAMDNTEFMSKILSLSK